MPVKVAVIGAGIIGLSTSAELVRAGAEVRCYEAVGVASAQSKGATRIFRHAHGDPRLVELAVRAGAKWRTWEMRFGRRLVGPEGLIITGDRIVPLWERAMQEGGAASRLLTKREGGNAVADRRPSALRRSLRSWRRGDPRPPGD